MTMLKEHPDHLDADLILKIYDLRREAVMRESRAAINRDYWPRTAEEALDVLRPDHPLNRAYRQCIGYWEMVYGMARHGVIHAEFLVENNGEGMFFFARVEPYLESIRKASIAPFIPQYRVGGGEHRDGPYADAGLPGPGGQGARRQVNHRPCTAR